MSKPSPIIKIRESEIQRQILDWLALKGFFFWRANTGSFGGEYKGKKRFVRFGRKGQPDIFVVWKGHIIGIEVKRPGEDISDQQAEWSVEFSRAGGDYIVARSVDDVDKWFGPTAAQLAGRGEA